MTRADRRVEVVERLLLDQCREVRADAAVRPALLDDHRAVRLPHGLEDRVEVERAQRARVDHLGLDLVLGLERARPPARAVIAMREMPTIVTSLALAAHRRLAEATVWSVVVGHLAALPVEVLVLDEDHRVVVADRRLQQALRVGRR